MKLILLPSKHTCVKSFFFLASTYFFKINNGNTKAMSEIGSKLTIKTLKQCQWRSCGVFIINFEKISHIALVFPLLTLCKKMSAGLVYKSILSLRTIILQHDDAVTSILYKLKIMSQYSQEVNSFMTEAAII